MLSENEIISEFKTMLGGKEKLFSFSDFIIESNKKADGSKKTKRKYPDSIADLLNIFYTTFHFDQKEDSEVVKSKYFENLKLESLKKIIDIEDSLNKQVFFIIYVFNNLKIVSNFANGKNIRHYCSRLFKSNAQIETLLKKNKSTNIEEINGAFSLNVENDNNNLYQMILNIKSAVFSHNLFFTKLKYKGNIGSIYDFYVNNKKLYDELLTDLQNFLLSDKLLNVGVTAENCLSILSEMNSFCEQAKNYLNDEFDEVHFVDSNSKKIYFREADKNDYHRLIILPSVVVSNKLNELFFKREISNINFYFKSHKYLVAYSNPQNIGSNAGGFRNQFRCNIPNFSNYTTENKINHVIKNSINPLDYFINEKTINVKEIFIFKDALLNLRVYDNEKNRMLSKKSIENILNYILTDFIEFIEELSYLLNNEKLKDSDLDNFDNELFKKIMLLELSFNEQKIVAKMIKDIIVSKIKIKDNENTLMWDDYAISNIIEYVENMLKELF